MTGSLASATGVPSPVSSAAVACWRNGGHCCEPGRILNPEDEIGFLICLNFVWTQSFCNHGELSRIKAHVLWWADSLEVASSWPELCPVICRALAPAVVCGLVCSSRSPAGPHEPHTAALEMFLKGAVDVHVLHVAVFIFTG